MEFKLILITILAITLIIIAVIHVYWIFGGEWGIDAAIPEKYMPTYNVVTQSSFMQVATFFVIIGLIAFAAIILLNGLLWDSHMYYGMVTLATKIIGGIFLLRAIGDFNVCGLFKNASDSKFARCDTKIYVPLCLFLGIGSMLVAYL